MLNSSQTGVSSSSSNTPSEGERRNLNSELWHACAGPLVSLPTIGSRVVYLPQGHSEQVAASTQREADAHIPNYPNLPPQLICRLHDVILHADMETDEVYCQMTLQPVTMQDKEPFLVPDIGLQSRQPNVFFCKTLTASDTSTHGGFSIPRRAAEKVFPVLDFTQQPPAQELVARDLHDVEWKFRHIFRGQPKRHLLTTGWSVFVSSKRLTAGDQVLFIRNEQGQLLLGIRRANRPQTALPSSVLSSDSMHIGVLAAAALAASTSSHFTVFYNPRASPSEFVIPYSKFEKAVYHTRVSIGMRFRMLFETEESSVRRYMGTITDISDLDPVRWPNSKWRSIKVGWDESTAGERQRRVSLWEIEPLTTFLLYPPTSNWKLKNPWTQSFSSSFSSEMELESLKNTSVWSQFQHGNNGFYGVPGVQGAGLHPSMGSLHLAGVPDFHDALGAEALNEIFPSKQLHVQPKPIQTADQTIQRIPLPPQEPTPMPTFPQPVAACQPPSVPFQHYKQSSENTLGQHGPLLQQQTPQQPPIPQLKSSGLHQQQSVHGSMNQQQTLYSPPSQTLKRSAPQQHDASPEGLPRQQPSKHASAPEQQQQLQYVSQETQQQQQLQHIIHEAQQQLPQSLLFQQQQSSIQPLKHTGALQQQLHGPQALSQQPPPAQHQQTPVQQQLKHSAALQQQLYGPLAAAQYQQLSIQQQLKHNGAPQQQPHGSQLVSIQHMPIQHQPKHNAALQQQQQQQLQLPTLLPQTQQQQQHPIQQQLKQNGVLQQQQQGPTLQQQMQMQQQLTTQQPVKQNALLQQVQHDTSPKQQTTQLEAPVQQLKPTSPLQQHGQESQLLQRAARIPTFQEPQNHSIPLEQLHQHQLTDFSSANCHLTAPQSHSTVNSSEPMSQSGLLESSNVLSSTSHYPFQLPLSTPQWAGSEPSTGFNSLSSSHNSFVLQSMLGNIIMDSDNHLVHPSAAVMQGGELHQDSKTFTSWSSAPRQPANILQADHLIDISGHSYVTAQTDVGVLPSFPSPGALSSTSFNLKDCHQQEQEDLHSDLHRQMLFGVNIDSSSVVMSASLSDGCRANNDDFQSQCMSHLMAAQSSETGAEFPFNCDLVNGDFDDLHFLQQVQTFSHVNQPVRTYTKVYKANSVGRSLDVTRFNNYDELRCELARLFGLGGQLEDPRSGWQLIFVDKENDWLLLGDDPWEVFVTNVRSIRILSPTEVFQMQDGIGLQTSFPVQQQQTSSSSDDVTIQQDSRNPASVITSTCSFDY